MQEQGEQIASADPDDSASNAAAPDLPEADIVVDGYGTMPAPPTTAVVTGQVEGVQNGVTTELRHDPLMETPAM